MLIFIVKFTTTSIYTTSNTSSTNTITNITTTSSMTSIAKIAGVCKRIPEVCFEKAVVINRLRPIVDIHGTIPTRKFPEISFAYAKRYNELQQVCRCHIPSVLDECRGIS
uniref:Uncharacterized protein n=1 Tax=viral metagenome TaxID=1070528 RepID=A0A6C0CLU5_9ZZZZ